VVPPRYVTMSEPYSGSMSCVRSKRANSSRRLLNLIRGPTRTKIGRLKISKASLGQHLGGFELMGQRSHDPHLVMGEP
jgi:hypothetical protein